MPFQNPTLYNVLHLPCEFRLIWKSISRKTGPVKSEEWPPLCGNRFPWSREICVHAVLAPSPFTEFQMKLFREWWKTTGHPQKSSGAMSVWGSTKSSSVCRSPCIDHRVNNKKISNNHTNRNLKLKVRFMPEVSLIRLRIYEKGLGRSVVSKSEVKGSV